MTFLELQSRVIQKLSESANPQYWTIDEIKANLNLAYRRFLAVTEFRTRTVALELVVAGYYKMPDDLMVPKKVYYGTKPLDQITREVIDHQLAEYQQMNAEVIGDMGSVGRSDFAWLFDDGYVRVYPAPEEDNDPVYLQKAEGVISAGSSVISLSGDWALDESRSLLFIGGILQYSSAWSFASSTSIQLDAAVPSDTPYLLVGLGEVGTASTVMQMRYVPKPADMSANADTPSWVPAAYHDVLWEYAVYECLSREGDGQDMRKAAFYFQRFEKSVAEFKSAFCRQVIPDRALPFVV